MCGENDLEIQITLGNYVDLQHGIQHHRGMVLMHSLHKIFLQEIN